MMKKNQLLFLSSMIFILIALLLIYHSSGVAVFFYEEKSDQATYLPFILKNYQDEFTIQGIIINGRTTSPVDGAEICILGGQICDISNHDGEYSLTEVPSGTHTLTVDHWDFPIYSDEFKIPTDIFNPFVIQLMPALDDGQWRVVLTWVSTPTWGDLPNNLESHLWFRDQHIYEGYKLLCENDLEVFPYACYETDAQFGSGPDTIVFKEILGDKYSFAVLHYFDKYDGVPPINDLEAVVEVYNSSGLQDRFTIDDVQDETGDLWYVFDLIYGDIVRQNCLQQYDNNGAPPTPCNLP